MKKTIYFICILLISAIDIIAQDNTIINLPSPETSGGMPLFEVLSNRKSTRSFDSKKELNFQQISNLLWSAYGFNRDDKRTVPSGHNTQEFLIYVFTASGTYLWDAKLNTLTLIVAGDNRALCGNQDYVKDASLNLVYVADYSKMDKYPTEKEKENTAHVNCGFIGQNVYLYCASEGLACIFRGWINKDVIRNTLQLDKHQHVMFSQSVGYEK